jgi:endonuclease/exonuclease/phosphatase family metal-dependent hydrolase
MFTCGDIKSFNLSVLTVLVASACDNGAMPSWIDVSVGAPAIHALTQLRKPASSRRPGVRRRVQGVNSPATLAEDAFTSKDECVALLKRGARLSRTPGTARIAAWNVRWFPDGVPGTPTETSHQVDLEWFACTLAWMNVDAVAFAEIKSKPQSAPAIEQVLQRLDALTNAKHIVHIDDCPDANGQHLAWLINEQHVTATDWQMHSPINPNGDACAGQLRPGLGVKLKFGGGLDLHAVAVHLKSGVESRDIQLRRASIDGMERVASSVTAQSGDADLLIVGDMNTMGCRECDDVTRSAAEASWLDTRLKAFHPGMRRVPSDLGCSLYFQRQPSLLDHFLVATAMHEAPVTGRASVYGHCRGLGCESYSGPEPESLLHLSDHCPILLELLDQDLD